MIDRNRLFTAVCIAATSFLTACGNSDNLSTPVTAGTKAGFVIAANGDNSVSSCVAEASGLISKCQFVVPDASLQSLAGISLTSGRVYLLDIATKAVDVCAVDMQGVPGQCVTSVVGGLLTMPMGIAVSDTSAYVGDGSGSVIGCGLDKQGQLSGCTAQTGGGTFSYPSSITLWNKQVYVLNAGNSTVTRCDAGSSGTLDNCTAGAIGSLTGSTALSSLTIASGHAYVTNGTRPELYACTMTASGVISACQTVTLDASMGMLGGLTVNGSVLYLASITGDALGVCALAADGSVSSCQSASGDAILSPIAVAFKPTA
ncbi:hypothetical protein EN871_32600 [bacterium M00.F.Ca.ET.228.01.1.1]|nr:hypothetical protein EN871_32600 [bacterium M00.F.Ca.ET.228.01.1.1]TGR95200.1 hypothetical protein EN834_32585 [bacterium M00.F.Ca.ET.191.01.1.1]TGT95997.1 hypothetical protein EN798_32595 [bacterium M00.F.Ca.ET.155.01.1.1]